MYTLGVEKGLPRGAWHCTSIAPSTFSSRPPSTWGSEPKDQAAIRVTVTVLVRVRVPKATKPRVPGTLGLQKACRGEHGPAATSVPPHLSIHVGT